MKIIDIRTEKRVKKTKKELEKDFAKCGNNWQAKLFVNEYKNIPSKEPRYIVEMSAKEIQLVSFYLELENRKPIMNGEEIKNTKEECSLL